MDTGSLRMVYVIFHKSICHRDFSGKGGLGGVVGSCHLSFPPKFGEGISFPEGILGRIFFSAIICKGYLILDKRY